MTIYKSNSDFVIITLIILFFTISITSTNFAFAGTPEEEAAQEAKKAAEEAASAAEQAASDAESAAQQAASDAESAAQQAASDAADAAEDEAAAQAEAAAQQAAAEAEAAAQQAASDAEAAAQAAASDAESAAQQAASDAESAAQQAASDAEAAAQQAASDAEAAAQQAASDAEAAAQQAASDAEAAAQQAASDAEAAAQQAASDAEAAAQQAASDAEAAAQQAASDAEAAAQQAASDAEAAAQEAASDAENEAEDEAAAQEAASDAESAAQQAAEAQQAVAEDEAAAQEAVEAQQAAEAQQAVAEDEAAAQEAVEAQQAAEAQQDAEAQQAASDAEAAAQQAASDAESDEQQIQNSLKVFAQQLALDAEIVAQEAVEAAAQAILDAEIAAQEALSDEEIVAQEAALKAEKIKIFLSIKNNLSEIDQVKEKEDLGDNKPIKQENGNKKINTKISKLISSKDPESYAKKKGFDFHEGDTRLMINMNEIDDVALEKIKTLGTIEISKGDQIQIKIPAKKISELSSISEVKNIKPTLLPIQNKDIVVDGRIIEDSIFSKKYKSKNPVNVAIIDLAFDEENQKISNNIIDNISFRYLFENHESTKINNYEDLHGTAMAQIITNMLPDVKLHLLSAGTELEFIDAMDYAISKNVDIITIGYTWINYDTDGTSAITKKVEDAIKSEISVVIPSGNYAENHWEGLFKDTDGDKWHEFFEKDEGMTILVDKKRIDEQRPILIYLKWKNTTGFTADYDLTLMNKEGKIVDYSSSHQDESDDEHVEYLYHFPEIPGEYHIGISNFGFKHGYAELDIFSVYDKLEYSRSQGSVGVPADARGVVVVGSLGKDNKVQPFSSSGPTENGQNVPNILANDGIRTEAYQWAPFHGTSASTAYVSGLIAILYSETNTINPMSVTDLLFDNILESQPVESSDIQITGNAGKLAKSNAISDWYISLYEEEKIGQFPMKFTSNEKNNYKIISCEKDMIIIQNTVTKDLMCVTKSTAESMIKRDWIIRY